MSVTSKLKAWLQDQKDSTVSLVLSKALQNYLERFGRVVHLRVDSQQRTAQVELLLKGETEPIAVFIEEYQLLARAEGVAFVIKRARASREWITVLLGEFVVDRSFPVPEQYATAAKLLL